MLCKRPTEDVSVDRGRHDVDVKDCKWRPEERLLLFEGRRVQSRPRPVSGRSASSPHVAALGLWEDGVAGLQKIKITPSIKIQKQTKVMPSKFAKVTKQVSKKKGGALALHENSRDALRLRAAVARDDRVARLGAVREKLNDQYRMF